MYSEPCQTSMFVKCSMLEVWQCFEYVTDVGAILFLVPKTLINLVLDEKKWKQS